jgi:hypothetical protein
VASYLVSDGDGRDFYPAPEFLPVDHSCENNNSNPDSENRTEKHNLSVRGLFQTELGIRLAFHTTVGETQFWGQSGVTTMAHN